MSATLDTFRIVATEFASTVDATVETWVSLVSERISTEVLGARSTEAAARIVAHELTMLARQQAIGGAAVGPVQSKSAGQVSVSWGSQGFSTSRGSEDDWYRQTIHGLAYLQIRDSRAETGFGVLT